MSLLVIFIMMNLVAAVSYMYMYTCTSACNIIRERGEGGREGGREGWREGEGKNLIT